MSCRILHVINAFSVGGAELLVVNLAPVLVDLGFDVEILALSRTQGDAGQKMLEHLNDNGISWVSLDKPVQRGRFRIVRHLLDRTRIRKYDIIHTHCASPDFFGGLVSVMTGVKHVSTLHTLVQPTSAARVTAWRMTDLMARTHYIAISDAVANSWRKHRNLHRERITVVPNGVDPHRFEGLLDRDRVRQRLLHADSGQRVILAVGRLHPVKGFPCLIEAFALLTQQYRDLHLTILGDGPERASLEKLIERWALEGRVSIPGATANIAEAMRSADLLVVPSSLEGFGLVAVEGLMAGLPVVISNVDGLGELARRGAPVLTFPSGDASALAECITSLLDTPSRMVELGCAARPWAIEHCSLDAMARGYARVYERLLCSSQKSH